MSSQAQALQPIPLSQPTTQEWAPPRQQTLRPTAVADTNWLWHVIQWKYTVDDASPWLKRFFFHHIFLRFNRWAYDHFDLLPPNGRDPTGRLCWIEHQGTYETEWEAEQQAAKYRYGHVIDVPFHASLPAETVNTIQVHPNSSNGARKIHERKANKNAERDLILTQIQEKLRATDHLVEKYL